MSYDHDNTIYKLQQLRARVSIGDVEDVMSVEVTGRESDLLWIRRLLEDVQESGLVPNKEEFDMANLIWKKYSNGVEPNNENMWKLIDGMLTQQNPTKIGAIKMYRRFIDSTLKEAKEMVDAREKSISQGWHNVTVVKPNRSNS